MTFDNYKDKLRLDIDILIRKKDQIQAIFRTVTLK